MELVDLENRIKELNVSIVDMKELNEKNKKEGEQFVQRKNDEINRTNIAILKNEGRIDELKKLIEDLKKEEEVHDNESTSGN